MTKTTSSGEKIAKRARDSISIFCFEECDAYCCRKGFLILTANEAKLIVAKHDLELKRSGDLKQIKPNMFSLHLGNKLGSCPMLKNSRCSIHSNLNKPKICDTFPVFIDEKSKKIHFSSRCFAVKAKKMYPFEQEFLDCGYKLD